jgi:hypothetical protein
MELNHVNEKVAYGFIFTKIFLEIVFRRANHDNDGFVDLVNLAEDFAIPYLDATYLHEWQRYAIRQNQKFGVMEQVDVDEADILEPRMRLALAQYKLRLIMQVLARRNLIPEKEYTEKIL